MPWRPIDWIVNRLKYFGVGSAIVEPLGRWVGQFAKATRKWFSALLAWVAPREIFEDRTQLLKPDHFYAATSAVSVIIPYGFVYWLFKPTGPIRWPLEDFPPAGFIFALLLPLIWIISALWAWLGRYRLAFYLAIFISFGLAWVATRFGNPVHTYDVVAVEASKPLQRQDILQPLVQRGQKNLIIVAASGGGILAAGWTAEVLTKLHSAYPDFGRELRLISAVSGGSVGAAHYVNSVSEILRLTGDSQRAAALQEVAEDAMRSSLASTSYGLAFPDFKRAFFPFVVDEEFDRARLLEMDWRRIANCRRQTAKTLGPQPNFRQFCRNISGAEREKIVWFSQWREDIQRGDKPAVIFNATVMEAGERIAITPLSTLHSDWAGSMEYPLRRDNAQTLSEFLSAERDSGAQADPSKADKSDKAEETKPTCPQYTNGYDIDVWTAARLSATFSYVSPAARAACLNYKNKSRSSSGENSPGRLHLIDGGYHDNYGVASALDWLSTALEAYVKEGTELPVSRIALVEIRAKPDIPADTAQNEWSSSWLGPFWGLFNSWGYVQISSNDTAVNRRIVDFKKRLSTSAQGVQFDSFVFVSDRTGPLSWHLSEEQKTSLRASWNTDANQKVLKKLLEFLRPK